MQAARGASLTSEPRSHPGSRLGLVLLIAVVAWLVDLGTKALVVHRLTGHAPVEVLGPLLRLNLARNPGAAFSSGTGLTVWISLFAIAALVAVLVLGARARSTGWVWAMGLLTAGIAGNLTDRLFRDPGPLRGHVVDFLELPHWPIFNVADICINVAALLIVVLSFRGVPLRGAGAET
jgi:signal peptidase II